MHNNVLKSVRIRCNRRLLRLAQLQCGPKNVTFVAFLTTRARRSDHIISIGTYVPQGIGHTINLCIPTSSEICHYTAFRNDCLVHEPMQ